MNIIMTQPMNNAKMAVWAVTCSHINTAPSAQSFICRTNTAQVFTVQILWNKQRSCVPVDTIWLKVSYYLDIHSYHHRAH